MPSFSLPTPGGISEPRPKERYEALAVLDDDDNLEQLRATVPRTPFVGARELEVHQRLRDAAQERARKEEPESQLVDSHSVTSVR
ncbi:hypothetical protein OAO87_00990 [bacterium]|nr:hypothetical protein [bacterium]